MGVLLEAETACHSGVPEFTPPPFLVWSLLLIFLVFCVVVFDLFVFDLRLVQPL